MVLQTICSCWSNGKIYSLTQVNYCAALADKISMLSKGKMACWDHCGGRRKSHLTGCGIKKSTQCMKIKKRFHECKVA